MSVLSLALDTPDLAQHYERASVDRQFKSGKQLISRLAVKPGERVLDVGSGTGLLAEYVADLVGPTGSVHAVDPLPLRIEIAKRKTRHNLTFAVDDAFALDGLRDASFDLVYLNAVFHWFPEKLRPLRNFHRLLRSGGRLGIATGAKEHPNKIHDVQLTVLAREPYRDYVQREAGLPKRVSRDELAQLLEQSGFRVRSLSVEPHTTFHVTPAAAIEHAQASSFGNFLGHLPPELQERARGEIARELEPLRTDHGFQQDGARLVAVAEKP